jgi:hypothetical protein
MNNYMMPHALSDIKSLHVTHYGWHDLPQGLWIINDCILNIIIYPFLTLYFLKKNIWTDNILIINYFSLVI